MSELGMPEPLLPVHGFVLAGGQSSRMGSDKALLAFRGRPMVEIAVERLRSVCSAVSIAGNRDDLSRFAPVVHETRREAGPAAGLEAGLRACQESWALFTPVDVPLVPATLLREWARACLSKAEAGCGCSFLSVAGQEQPAFCLLKRSNLPIVEEAIEAGERRLRNLLWAMKAEPGPVGNGHWLWICDAAEQAGPLLDPEDPNLHVSNWFRNINTPEELREAETGLGPE